MANIEIISSVEEFDQFVQKQPPRTAVVHFCADWSEPCKQFNENLLALSADTKQLYFANVKAENVAELSAAYNVNAVPTVIFMKGRTEVDRIDGYYPDELKNKIRLYDAGYAPYSAAASESCMSGGTIDEPNRINEHLKTLINTAPCMLFMKGSKERPQCGFSREAVKLLDSIGAAYSTFDILSDSVVREALKKFSNWPTFPQIYLDGELIGGVDVLREELQTGGLAERMPKSTTTTIE